VISRAEINPEVNPWLDKTQWLDYFKGYELGKAVNLINLPDSSATAAQSERCLSTILAAFDQLIEQSQQALRERKVNVFDQQRVGSFISRKDAIRSFVYKMQDASYRKYKLV
jgi:hypothetical protein